MATFAYRRPIPGHGSIETALKAQTAAIKAMATMRGQKVEGISWQAETTSTTDDAFKVMLSRIEPGDVVFVAETGVLGSEPSVMMDRAGKLLAKGAAILVASEGRELDFSALRQFALAFAPMEAEIERLSRRLEADRKAYRQEIDDYVEAVGAHVSKLLKAANISPLHIAKVEAEAGLTMPSDGNVMNALKGRELRDRRLALGLTMEDAGANAPGGKALSKSIVSKLETGEGTAENFRLYERAVAFAEQHRANQAKMGEVNGQPGNPREALKI